MSSKRSKERGSTGPEAASPEPGARVPGGAAASTGLLLPPLNIPDLGGIGWSGPPRRGRDGSGRLDPLRLRVPSGAVDPVGSAALRALESDLDQDPDALRRELSQRGLTTEVLAVSKQLDGTNMSDLRRHVLARSYVSILADLLEPGTVEVGAGPSERPEGATDSETDDEARPERAVPSRQGSTAGVDFADTNGAVLEVLAALEADGGPLETFVRYLVGGILTNNRRDTSDDVLIGVVVGEILATV